MPQFKLNTFSVEAKDASEANKKMIAVSTIIKHLSLESLAILAQKSSKPGINNLIPQFAHLIK